MIADFSSDLNFSVSDDFWSGLSSFSSSVHIMSENITKDMSFNMALLVISSGSESTITLATVSEKTSSVMSFPSILCNTANANSENR